MSDTKDRKLEQLVEANEQLQASLRICHELVAEYRAKLTANVNDPLPREGVANADGDSLFDESDEAG